MINEYVVSLELAKRMRKLGWKKETIWTWINFELDGYDIGSLSELDEDDYFAPLFAEIWEELPLVIIYANSSYFKVLTEDNTINYLNFDDGVYPGEFPFQKADGNISKNGGKIWCWLKENGYIND